MKKIYTLALILLTVSVTFGQKKKYSFGFEVAPHISWGKSNTKFVKNNKTTFGFKYGLRGDSFFGENYAITSGLMVSHTSASLRYENDTLNIETIDETYDTIVGGDITYGFQYLEIPLGIKFRSNEIGYIRLLFEGGFIPAIRIKSTVESDKHNIDNEEFKTGTSLFALSYYFEGGITYSLGASIAIKLSLYYANGMIDLTSDDIRGKDKITQNQTGLKVGVVF